MGKVARIIVQDLIATVSISALCAVAFMLGVENSHEFKVWTGEVTLYSDIITYTTYDSSSGVCQPVDSAPKN